MNKVKSKRYLYVVLFFVFVTFNIYSQNYVGIGTSTPNGTLEVASTNSGVIIPKYTSLSDVNLNVLPNMMSGTHDGLQVYVQEEANRGFWFFNGTAFEKVGDSGGGSSNGIDVLTKAQRDALVSPATGKVIYQTDEYQGLYAYDGTYWRCQSGDCPIHFIDLGEVTSSNVSNISTLTLDGSHHTIYVTGKWNVDDFWTGPTFVLKLPDPTTCKGRVYKIVVQNRSTINGSDAEDGNHILLEPSPADGYTGYNYHELNPFSDAETDPLGYHLGDGRCTVLQSNGVEWYQIEDDKVDQTQF